MVSYLQLDWEIYPTTPWNYGLIIPEQFLQDGVKVVEKPLGDCPFSPDQAPIELEVEGRLGSLSGNF